MRNPPSIRVTLTGAAHDQSVVERIAQETRTPVSVVAGIYDEEVAALMSDGAKITQFLSVLASRRVRLRLRTH